MHSAVTHSPMHDPCDEIKRISVCVVFWLLTLGRQYLGSCICLNGSLM